MTKMQYLEDTYLFASTATIQDTGTHEKFGPYLILDQTVFYPQGGGQAADTGTISNDKINIIIHDTRLDPKSGNILHFGDIPQNLQLNQAVNLKINAQQRIINARLHSAGHLIDNAIYNLQNTGLKPIKGHFFGEGASVECAGILDDTEEFKIRLTNELKSLINKNLKFFAKNLSNKEANQENISAPEGKKVRVVAFEGFEFSGCGGTHVRNSSEIGHIKIRKVKRKKDHTKISYTLED